MTSSRSVITAAKTLVLLLLLALSPACSTFHRDWKAASRTPPPGNDITGRWEGTWLSEENGHTGRLRCLVTQQAEGTYLARFHAKYKRIFSFGYDVPLSVTHEAPAYKFTGEADLGKLAGGVYSYKGSATPTNFFSTYECASDRGTFQMSRP